MTYKHILIVKITIICVISCQQHVFVDINLKAQLKSEVPTQCQQISSPNPTLKNFQKVRRVDNQNITEIGCCVSGMRESAKITECPRLQSNHRNILFLFKLVIGLVPIYVTVYVKQVNIEKKNIPIFAL